MNTLTKGLLAVLVIALIGALALLFLRDDEVTLTVDEPEIVSASQLSDLAADADPPIYWVGERDGVEYEVTETSTGRFYVRYLEDGAEAGDERAEFVTVGSYPSRNGVGSLRRAADNRGGSELGKTADGAVLLIDPSSPNNAHFAYRGDEFQVEVFSPVPGEALRLASEGQATPVP